MPPDTGCQRSSFATDPHNLNCFKRCPNVGCRSTAQVENWTLHVQKSNFLRQFKVILKGRGDTDLGGLHTVSVQEVYALKVMEATISVN